MKGHALGIGEVDTRCERKLDSGDGSAGGCQWSKVCQEHLIFDGHLRWEARIQKERDRHWTRAVPAAICDLARNHPLGYTCCSSVPVTEVESLAPGVCLELVGCLHGLDPKPSPKWPVVRVHRLS